MLNSLGKEVCNWRILKKTKNLKKIKLHAFALRALWVGD